MNSFNPFSCEALETRSMMSVSPIAAPVIDAPAARLGAVVMTPFATTRRSPLVRFMAGNWVHTTGTFAGVTMQLRHVYNSDGTYLVQRNYSLNSYGMPRQTRWTNLDYGFWKAVPGKGNTAVVTFTSNTRSSRGHQSIGYVRIVSPTLIDVGVMPANASPNTTPVWMHFGRMI